MKDWPSQRRLRIYNQRTTQLDILGSDELGMYSTERATLFSLANSGTHPAYGASTTPITFALEKDAFNALTRIKTINEEFVTKLNEEYEKYAFPEFFCPLTNEVMTDPVVAPDGISYERNAIERVSLGRDPVLTPNQPLLDRIREYGEEVKYKFDATDVLLSVLPQELDHVMEINLNGLRIGDHGMVALSKASEYLISLKDLDVGGNSIGDRGMIAFSEACQSGRFPKLKTLNLYYNTIGEEGMEEFSNAIINGHSDVYPSFGSRLKILNLGFNRIGDAGMISFTHVITPSMATYGKESRLPLLAELNLCQNQIRYDGMKQFSDAITHGALPRLRSLSVYGNYVSPSLDPGIANLRLAREDVTVESWRAENGIAAQARYEEISA